MVMNPDNMRFVSEERAPIAKSVISQTSNEDLKAMMEQIQKELKQRENFHRVQLTDKMVSSIRDFRDEFPCEEMFMTFDVDEDEVMDGEFVLPVHEVLDYIAARGWHSE
jgi:hypothetical protein